MDAGNRRSRSAIRIRRAEPADFLGIAALDRVAWRGSRHGRFIPDGEHVWRIWCDHALTFAAWHGSQIVGVIVAFPCADGQYCLHKVMVANRCRGLGIATRLMQSLLRHIDRKGARIFLTVDPLNDPALRLHEKWGFTERTLIRGFYRKNEDRYVLTRPGGQGR
jgi:[ribosomal protein S18]-alanine N-acetyltransferase